MKKRISIEGKKVHQVGYRPFLLAKAMRLKIPNFDAENIEENGEQKVLISMIGEEKQISDFVEFAKENFPKFAKGCKVSEEISLPEAVMPIDDYQKLLNAEQQNNMIQGGLQIGKKIDSLKKETTLNFDRMDANFARMDEKYDSISRAMLAVVDRIEKRNETFENRIEKIVNSNEKRNKTFEDGIEKTEKNIESLLKILAEKKS